MLKTDPIWYWLLAGTVPSSKNYLDGTVPSSKKLVDGTSKKAGRLYRPITVTLYYYSNLFFAIRVNSFP